MFYLLSIAELCCIKVYGKLRNLTWVMDFNLLEWHFLEGTINQKLEAGRSIRKKMDPKKMPDPKLSLIGENIEEVYIFIIVIYK